MNQAEQFAQELQGLRADIVIVTAPTLSVRYRRPNLHFKNNINAKFPACSMCRKPLTITKLTSALTPNVYGGYRQRGRRSSRRR